ncbi:pseudouridine synthase [Methylophaga sp. UBA3191]|uniref:pseudouridine synthase n=1 Tax=Methylophaga sp. UBA3191 TaxID=1946881 RepID=UPI000C5D6F61|nr:pseudouridine synthase [Methylophaga sp. UBA3191]MBN48554.1 pseudouridine synthase [Spongiibacteraceae bacterium]|tara:strand:- start:187 stop:801 length:615 start_codon:yes stop_codon:yes gene_type:complete
MSTLVLFNKPFRVLSQFRSNDARETLANYLSIPGVYPAGRLDFDSEGLMILTDDGQLQAQISHPKHKLQKTYWVQVDGNISDAALQQLRDGVVLNDGATLPARANRIAEPAGLWPRDPPVRVRQQIPTSWVEIKICEGRNRQVRRMTAQVGFPTLRLIRAAIGDWQLGALTPGEFALQTLHAARRPARARSSRTKPTSGGRKRV